MFDPQSYFSAFSILMIGNFTNFESV